MIEGRGTIKTSCWLTDENGRQFNEVFGRWRLVTDDQTKKDNGLSRFRSGEGWHLEGLNDFDRVMVVVPGCKVEGFVRWRSGSCLDVTELHGCAEAA